MGPLVYPSVLCVNLLFRKFVGCGGPKLTGVCLGRVSFGEPLVQGHLWRVKKKKKKKRKHGHNCLSPRKFWFLILFSFCLLTVTLYSHFKQSTHAKKTHSFIIFLSMIYTYFFRKQTTHTRTHKELSGDVNNFSFLSFFYGLLPCCLIWC